MKISIFEETVAVSEAQRSQIRDLNLKFTMS